MLLERAAPPPRRECGSLSGAAGAPPRSQEAKWRPTLPPTGAAVAMLARSCAACTPTCTARRARLSATGCSCGGMGERAARRCPPRAAQSPDLVPTRRRRHSRHDTPRCGSAAMRPPCGVGLPLSGPGGGMGRSAGANRRARFAAVCLGPTAGSPKALSSRSRFLFSSSTACTKRARSASLHGADTRQRGLSTHTCAHISSGAACRDAPVGVERVPHPLRRRGLRALRGRRRSAQRRHLSAVPHSASRAARRHAVSQRHLRRAHDAECGACENHADIWSTNNEREAHP